MRISGELPFGKKVLKLIAYPFYIILTKGDYTYWIKKILKLPTAHKVKYIGNVVWVNSEKDTFLSERFENKIKVSFEGEEFDAPANYHEYLEHFYGDYMKIPEEKDRIIHDFDYYEKK